MTYCQRLLIFLTSQLSPLGTEARHVPDLPDILREQESDCSAKLKEMCVKMSAGSNW